VASQNRLSDAQKSQVVIDTFSALSNLNGTLIFRAHIKLMLSDPKNPDYEQGADNATICAGALTGKLSTVDWVQPFYDEARKLSDASKKFRSPGDSGLGDFVGSLIHVLWFNPILKRFGELTK